MTRRNNPFELHPERLATTSETGKRVYLYPSSVRGFFKKRRTLTQVILIAVFLTLPWLSFRGHQLVLLDVPNRRFAIFGLTFWAHEIPVFFFVLFSFVLGIVLTTALFGRVWCGWACPQTVFIEGLFRRIETWIEGEAFERRRLDQGKWTPKKILKKALKWSSFAILSLLITHSVLAYFVGADQMLKMIHHSPFEHPSSFLIILFSTALILFDFGWFKEQFCIIACPYGRLQSVLMDENSLVVGYDFTRGEPRKKDRHDVQAAGDCLNCYRCVQVCPTGVDIRRGTQLECIMCTACIDACDEVMSKVGKPLGLIRYDSEQGLKGFKTKFARIRLGVYALLCGIALLGLIFTLRHRDRWPIHIVRGRELVMSETENHVLVNRFTVTIRNEFFSDMDVRISSTTSVTIKTPFEWLHVPAGESVDEPVFIEFPKDLLINGQRDVELIVHSETHGQIMTRVVKVKLLGA